MDVHCSSCGEPWDAYHLRHDAIFEIAVDQAEAEAWHDLSPAEQLSSRYRQEFQSSRIRIRRFNPRCPLLPVLSRKHQA